MSKPIAPQLRYGRRQRKPVAWIRSADSSTTLVVTKDSHQELVISAENFVSCQVRVSRENARELGLALLRYAETGRLVPPWNGSR